MSVLTIILMSVSPCVGYATDVAAMADQSSIGVDESKHQTREKARLFEEIDRRIAHDKTGPKLKFIISNVKEPEYREYMEQWTRHIEEVGNQHYPDYAERLELHGNVVLGVAIGRNGELLRSEILRSSGSEILDNAAIEITKLASPFPSIPSYEAVEILYITRTWQF
jgi:periplasmic protein TonB